MQAIKDKDWTSFARNYNGPDYKKNKYDSKMQVAYEALKDDELGGLDNESEETTASPTGIPCMRVPEGYVNE